MIDQDKARKVVNFIERICTHVKGELANKPFLLEDWQKDYLVELFGRVHEDGLRQYRTSFVFLPRKNGKSNLIAAMGLYILFMDNEPGAEIYIAAADRDQANAIFEVQKQMILNSKYMYDRCKIFRNSIVLNGTNSFVKAISADAKTKHGFNAHAVLYDELHAAPSRELWEVLTTSTGARTQPLVVGISTAGHDKGGLCKELYGYAKQIISGAAKDNTFLPVIYEADIDDDIFDTKTWYKANPNLGISIRPDYFDMMSEKARIMPTDEVAFRQLHLNQWVGASEGWITDHDWMESAGEVNISDLLGQKCYGGLDLAATEDVCSFCLVFPRDNGDMKVLVWNFVSSAAVERRRGKTGASYDAFVTKGDLIVTDGNSTDYNYIYKKVTECAEMFDLQSTAFDRFNSSSLVQRFMEAGLDMDPYGQGYVSMTPPIREMEIMVKRKQLHHGGHSMLRWMASNIQVKMDEAMNIKFNKSRSGDKIDGMVALAMAVGEWMTCNRQGDGSSVYEDQGLRVL